MDQFVPVVILVVVFALILAAMYAGWRRRGRSQSDLPAPRADTSPEDLGEVPRVGPVEAVYVNTVLADRPLERVVAHGLGTRSRARITLGSGGSWRIQRRGGPSLTIPADDVAEVTAAGGMAGKFIGGDGLLVIRWRLGERDLDTGLRLAHRADHDLLLSRKEHS